MIYYKNVESRSLFYLHTHKHQPALREAIALATPVYGASLVLALLLALGLGRMSGGGGIGTGLDGGIPRVVGVGGPVAGADVAGEDGLVGGGRRGGRVGGDDGVGRDGGVGGGQAV